MRPDRARRKSAKPTADDAQRFAEGVAARLGIAPERVQPAYEDPAYFLLEEGKLPVNADVGDPKLFDAAARARIVRAFARGLGTPAAFILPLRRDGDAWLSETWDVRREHLFLLPGDLPAGSRLPLASLPHVAPSDYPYLHPADPMAEPADSRTVRAGAARLAGRDNKESPVRTALAVEPREKLCVFMPLLGALEDYSRSSPRSRRRQRNSSFRSTSKAMRRRSIRALEFIKVTPDPGVLEVNLHAARSWRETVEVAQGLYADARATRLATEKFMRDGRADRHRRRQPHRDRRRDAGRKPVPAPPRSAQEHRALLAAPPVALLSVLRPVHRPDQPVAARRRGAPRAALRAGDRARAGAQTRRGGAALAARPPVPQPAGRRHRQHASRRDLRR